MKIASKVFIIIGLVTSLFAPIAGLILMAFPNLWLIGVGVLAYGIYGIFISVGALISIHCSSKAVVIVMGVMYLPISLLASIFMFCIDPRDLY